MDNDDQEVKNCEIDGEYRVYSDVCDTLCIERVFKSHLKSGNFLTNFHK